MGSIYNLQNNANHNNTIYFSFIHDIIRWRTDGWGENICVSVQLVFCYIYYIYQKYKYCLLCGCVTSKSKSTFNNKLREDCKNTAGGKHKRAVSANFAIDL